MGIQPLENLYKLYNNLNLKFFNDELPNNVKIEWSNRLTSSAGNCNKNKRVIKLSTHYHKKFLNEIENTLLHEMIHLKIDNHGIEFKKELNRIQDLGGNVSRYSKEKAIKKSFNWIYTCNECKKTYYRYKRVGKKYICGICRGKLIEKKIEKII